MVDSGGEAHLTRLLSLFQRDPLIDEVGLLFGLEASDLTPETAFFLEDHKLGVAFAAGMPLFQAARTQFHQLNALLQHEASEITQSEGTERRAQLLHCTRAILLISADFYTAWNTRKSFVTRGWLEAQDEVQFTNLVLTLHPKSIDTWAYRRWLAARLCDSLSHNDRREFYKQQIEVCSRLAEQKPRNYHAWSFRHWIVSRMPLEQTLQELEEMEQWCKTHVTDHSGWNHRQHTINELAKRYEESGEDNNSSLKVILDEYKFVSGIMAPYPTHEALWCHRRFVVHGLLNHVSRGEINSGNMASVHEMISRATSTLSSAKREPFEAATLIVAWDEILDALRSNSTDGYLVLRALMCEIKTAWVCGNQFSRRYATWCHARLRIFCADDKQLERTLITAEVRSSLQKHLINEDVLEDLWIRM